MDESVTAVLIKLGIVFLLVLTNGYFVAAEFAMVSVRRSRIAALVTDGNKHAQIVMRHLDDMTGFISACQVGVTVASLVLGALGESTIAHLLEPVFAHLPGSLSAFAVHSIASTIAIIIVTYLHLLLGEFVPKALALERAERVALAVARPMAIFYKTFKAPIWVINQSGAIIIRLLGLHSTGEHTAAYSEDELRHLIELSRQSGHVMEDEKRLIDNVFEFTEANVESVMTPRMEIEALDILLSPAEMLDRFEHLGYSRMPVYRESLDNVFGILLYKDLSRIMRRGGAVDVNDILRPPVYLPTSVKLHEALRTLRRTSEHMAMVVDEHGSVKGLVTLEDLLEEIVGEIRDEHDETAVQQIRRHNDDSFTVSGALTVRDANRRMNLGLPESDSYHTIAGFMMARKEKLMKQGESVDYNGLRFTVESATRHRISEARIDRLSEENAPAPSAAD